MAISDKLNYLIETKQLFKDRLNSLGAEITSSTTFRNYLTWLDAFYGKVSDKTDISVNGVVGRTSQESTTGANIMPVINVTKTVNGITLTNNGNGTITLNGTATAQVLYPITNTGNNTLRRIPVTENDYKFMLYGDTNVSNDTYFLQVLFGTETETTKFFASTDNGATSLHIATDRSIGYALVIRNGQSFNNHIIKPMGVLSTYTGGFEPYTKGASPNPDYPQPINNLSGDVPYKVSGKNLNNGIDYKFYIGSTGTTYRVSGNDKGLCIEVNEESSYTISTTTTQNRYRVACCNSLPTTTEQRCYNGTNKDGTRDNIIINTTGYKYLLVNATDLTTIQIEKGSTATDFEPYIEPQTFNIPLGDIELCKIDTYEDKIYSSNGRFYLNKNIKKVILNGSETIKYIDTKNSNHAFYIQVSNVKSFGTFNEDLCIYSDRLEWGNMNMIYNETEGITPSNGNSYYYTSSIGLYTEATKSMTVEQFKTWLSNNNVVVYYILNTPTTTEITQENYPSLYNALKQIQDYLTAYKINKEFILGYSSPEIEY